MAVWCLCRGLDVLDDPVTGVGHSELSDRLSLTQAEIDHWDDVSRKMKVCFHDGVISQFEGYEALEELDWDALPEPLRRTSVASIGSSRPRATPPIATSWPSRPTSRCSSSCCRPTSWPPSSSRLGYAYDPDLIPRTVAYYDRRTSHGSTLSRVVDAWVHARLDREESWKIFLEVLAHGHRTTRPGGPRARASTWVRWSASLDLLQRGYAGVETRDDVLRLHPGIPRELRSLAFQVRYRRHLVDIEVTTEQRHRPCRDERRATTGARDRGEPVLPRAGPGPRHPAAVLTPEPFP